jgi:predicted O-methyltransferase YrrM
MGSPLAMSGRFLKHLLSARTLNGVHSPFLFEFFSFVLDKNRRYYAFERIEKERRKLLKDDRIIRRTDFGAGSSVIGRQESNSISQIARHALSSPSQCSILFRSAVFLNANTIIELGSSLGISTQYLATADRDSKIYSIDGDPELISIASKMADKLEIKNIQFCTGSFEEVLPGVVAQRDHIDLVFLDGYHKKEPVLKYFELLLAKCHNNTAIILDDIHWSTEMEAAWKVVQAHPKVTAAIDLFQFGMVFFK